VPKPHRGERQREYVSRAVKHMMEFEGLRQKHAVAKAYGMWKQGKKKRSK
jgi:hypothetical protein